MLPRRIIVESYQNAKGSVRWSAAIYWGGDSNPGNVTHMEGPSLAGLLQRVAEAVSQYQRKESDGDA